VATPAAARGHRQSYARPGSNSEQSVGSLSPLLGNDLHTTTGLRLSARPGRGARGSFVGCPRSHCPLAVLSRRGWVAQTKSNRGCGMGYQSASRSPSSPSTLADLSQQWTPLCASAQKIKIKMVGNRRAEGPCGLQIFSVHDSDGSGAQRHVKHNASHTSAVSVRANQFANVEHQHAIQPGGS